MNQADVVRSILLIHSNLGAMKKVLDALRGELTANATDEASYAAETDDLDLGVVTIGEKRFAWSEEDVQELLRCVPGAAFKGFPIKVTEEVMKTLWWNSTNPDIQAIRPKLEGAVNRIKADRREANFAEGCGWSAVVRPSKQLRAISQAEVVASLEGALQGLAEMVESINETDGLAELVQRLAGSMADEEEDTVGVSELM